MSMGVIGRRALVALAVTTIALTGVFTTAAGAAQNEPPGWVPQPGDEWVAFTLDDYSPAPSGRTGHEPVTLRRESAAGFDISWFSNWDALDTDGVGGPDQFPWPSVWEAGGIRLERVDACDWTASECRYSVVSGSGQQFWFFAGNPPVDPGTGQPVPSPNDYAGPAIDLAAGPTITIGPLGAVGVAGTGGAAGKIQLDALGTVDGLAGTTLTYQWKLVHVDTGTPYDSGAGAGDSFEFTVQHDGNYCVEVTVTASDGHSVGTPTCASGTGALFNITGVAPAPSGGGGGGGGGTPPPGGGGGGGGGGAPGIGFSNPVSRAPSVLTGGGSASPTVVWLWRPEWYQSEPTVEERPQTAGRPELNERRDIVITGGSRAGSNAGPWLAGLGVAGLLGGGWLVSRRRRMRMLAEL